MAQDTTTLPPQHQDRQPGVQSEMQPKPQELAPREPYGKRFAGKTFLVTGADSGIGRAIALAAAREGARVTIAYLNEDRDAEETISKIESFGSSGARIRGDVGDASFCERAVDETLSRFGSIDVLVNDAGEQHPQDDITKIGDEQLERTFRTNIFGYIRMTRAAPPHLKAGSSACALFLASDDASYVTGQTLHPNGGTVVNG